MLWGTMLRKEKCCGENNTVGKMRQRTMLRETLGGGLALCLKGRLLDEWIEKSAVACLYSFNRLGVSSLTSEVFIAQCIGHTVRPFDEKLCSKCATEIRSKSLSFDPSYSGTLVGFSFDEAHLTNKLFSEETRLGNDG
jgi:hypothetical protein